MGLQCLYPAPLILFRRLHIDVIPADFVDSGICTCVFVDLLSNRVEFNDFSGVFGSKIVCYTLYKLMNKF